MMPKKAVRVSFPQILICNSCWNLRKITTPIVILCIGYVELNILC